MTAPLLSGLLQRHFDPRMGRQRPPAVQAPCVQRRAEIEQALRMNPHATPDRVRNRHADFMDVDGQCVAVPVQLAGPDRELGPVAAAVALAAFGHGPAFGAAAVKRNVEGAVVVGGRLALAALGPGVVGRKHTADKGDDGQAPLTAVAPRVKVPPEVAARGDRLV